MHSFKTTKLALLAAMMFGAAMTADAGRGAADAGGWAWIDSNEPGIDTSVESMSVVNTLLATIADDEVASFNLGFPFSMVARFLRLSGFKDRDRPMTTSPFGLVEIPTRPSSL